MNAIDLFQDTTERKTFVDQVAADMGVAPWVVEKDLWVCWTLARLQEVQDLPEMTFKGGTSLSKVHRLVERFSEDIDLTFSREGWGFTEERDPERSDLSHKKRARLVEEIATRSARLVAEVVVPGLQAACSPLPGSWSIEISPEDPQAVLFAYPEPSSAYAYGRPIVKVEFGARGDPWPTQQQLVRPYIEEHYPGTTPTAISSVHTLDPARTFWEKATLLHALHHATLVKPEKTLGRLSRHLYDLHRIWIREDLRRQILENPKLLDAVVRNKRTFFRDPKASYELVDEYRLNAAPHDALREALRDDFTAMQDMFFPNSVRPDFDELIETLRQIDEAVAAWKPTQEGA